MKILVTGGSGFIGTHLCSLLLNEGNEVICLDNLSTSRETNIENLKKNKNFNFLLHDIIVPIDIKIDYIVNLACPTSPKMYQDDPVKTIQTNVIGMKNMLDLAKKNNCKIFQASTSEVYGDPLIHPQTEDYWGNVNPIGIRSCYDEGKRCTETLCFDYMRQYKLQIKVARIFNTYGPLMAPDDGRVVSNFIVQALEGKPITIYGDGKQTRSFCYIEDTIKGIYKLMHSSDLTTGPINLGNNEEYKIIDLAKLVINETKSKSELIYKDLPMDDPMIRMPDITLAKEHLDWYPQTNITDGLRYTIDYFSKILAISK